MTMIGSRNSVPISRNACDFADDAASQRLIVCGTMLGHTLIASPAYPVRKSAIAAKNGVPSRTLYNECQSHAAISAAAIGTGASQARFGHENQRSAIFGSSIGVQMLTTTMKTTTP